MSDVEDFLDSEVHDLNQAITLGEAMAGALRSKDSLLNHIIDRAREEAAAAGQALLAADLYSEAGLEQARHWQREYLRFQSIMEWVAETGERADQALHARSSLDGYDEEERLRKELMHERSEDLSDV